MARAPSAVALQYFDGSITRQGHVLEPQHQLRATAVMPAAWVYRARILRTPRKAATPFQRTLDHKATSKACRAAMRKTMSGVSPPGLHRRIQALTEQLERMALAKTPAPVNPRVNRAWNE